MTATGGQVAVAPRIRRLRDLTQLAPDVQEEIITRTEQVLAGA